MSSAADFFPAGEDEKRRTRGLQFPRAALVISACGDCNPRTRRFQVPLLALFIEVENTYGTELQACAVTEETDVSRLVEHAGMVLVVNRVGIVA